MIDVVYVLGRGSRWEDNELRYSLRSIEKHLKDFGKVWIVGEKPAWVTNVNHIPATDPYRVPDTNILYKLKIACNNAEISDTFLFMNDDHFLLHNFNTETFPFYYSGTLEQYTRKRGQDSYGRRCVNSMKWLKMKGYNTLYFDTHYPIRYQKKAFLEIFKDVEIDRGFGYVIKSIYANAMNFEDQEIMDCKFSSPPSIGQICFSTYPNPSTEVRNYLLQTFPDKSKFEI